MATTRRRLPGDPRHVQKVSNGRPREGCKGGPRPDRHARTLPRTSCAGSGTHARTHWRGGLPEASGVAHDRADARTNPIALIAHPCAVTGPRARSKARDLNALPLPETPTPRPSVTQRLPTAPCLAKPPPQQHTPRTQCCQDVRRARIYGRFAGAFNRLSQRAFETARTSSDVCGHLRTSTCKSPHFSSCPDSIMIGGRGDSERLGDQPGVLLMRRVVQILHRRLDVGMPHPLLHPPNIRLGDHPRAERVP